MTLATRLRTLLTASFLATALAASAAVAVPPGVIGDLYVTGDISNTVRVYNQLGFNFLGVFQSTTNSPLGIHFGRLNGRVLVGGFNSGVFEYDVATGAYIRTYGNNSWQWAGIYTPGGNVFVSEFSTGNITEYDGNTGAFVRLVCNIPGGPADMQFGPNGHLYVPTFGSGMVYEIAPGPGVIVSAWALPVVGSGCQGNDVAFLNGEILVTESRANRVWRFDSTPAHNVLGWFANPLWGLVHGIEISPHNGHIYVCDGASAQVSEFDPNTFALLNGAVLNPPPADKVVDLEFRRDDRVTPTTPSTWGRIKSLYR